jgi:hypothetical protein
MGLKDSHHISKIIVDPNDADIVYVASMGHLYTTNAERGVFKTTDGGKTWGKVLYIDDKTGVIDMIMNPSNPTVLYASAYEKIRYPWHFEAGGKNSAVYKTMDGGKNWSKTLNGLPDGELGRIGSPSVKAIQISCTQWLKTSIRKIRQWNLKPKA